MKSVYFVIVTLISFFSFAQVGINTTSPESTFEIRGRNHTSTPGPVHPNDGILVPRVTSLATSGTVNGQLVYLISDADGFQQGFHYWTGSVWRAVGGDGDGWNVTGESTTNSIGRTGNVAIGNALPNVYAKLDIVSANQGVLLPRIDLTTSTLDLNTDGDNNVANQPAGLIIYNNGSTFPKGLYFWNGSFWIRFDTTTTVSPQITSLLCANARLDPPSYVSGVPYVGNLTIPYTGGNGGFYDFGSTIIVNGLQFVLRPQTLNFGSGELVFSVTGTPTVSSPISTTVAIQGSTGNNIVPFLTTAQWCSITVGNDSNAEIREVAFAGPLTLVTTPRLGYEFVGTSPDGRFSVRVFCPNNLGLASNANLQLRWNGSASDPSTIDIIQNTSYWWNGGGGSQAGQVRYPKNQWAGYDGTSGTLQTAVIQGASNNADWGNFGVYASNSPEYRYYNWSPFSGTDKIFYQLEFMMASATPSDNPNPTNCPGGVCSTTKVFIKIRQIRAL
jgi:hypothetical protein